MIDLDLLKHNVGDLNEDAVNSVLDEFMSSCPEEDDARAVLEACQLGMDTVGTRFEEGKYFVGDLIIAGAMLTSAVEKIKPLLGYSNRVYSTGVVVLGTVKGDIHHIGKNLFKVMLEAADFKVIDIGVNQPAESFLEMIERYEPEIVGLSGLLSTSVESMKEIVSVITDAGYRKKLKVIIGGNIVDENVCDYVGADAWNQNAYSAVRLCKKWIEQV